MAIKKINNKWHIVGKIKKEDGSYYNYKKVAKNCNSPSEARAFEVDFRRTFQDLEISKHDLTFEQLSKEYLQNIRNLKQSSLIADKANLRKAIDVFGNTKIRFIKPTILQKFIDDLDMRYSKSYVMQIYYTVKKAFDFGVERGHILTNPLRTVKIASRKDDIKKEMDYWEPHEFSRFIKEVNDSDYHLLFNFLYYMGCRRGEALALMWKDIDFETSSVKIYKTITDRVDGEVWAITSPKTKNSIRTISLPKNLCDELKCQKEKHRTKYGFNEDRFVFGYDRPLPLSNIRFKFRNYIAKTGDKENNIEPVKMIRVHDLRHSHASYLINNKSDKFTDFDIAKRLGDTVSMLHSTYAHWFKSADQNIIDFMNDDMK